MTLNDIYLALPNLYSESSARAYGAAFRRVEKMTGRTLKQIPADDVAWTEIARHIVWAGEIRAGTPEAAERAFHTWVGKISAAIRKAQESTASAPVAPDARLAWDQLIDYAKRVQNRPGPDGCKMLPGMADVSLANLRARLGHVFPAELDNGAAAEALSCIPADKTASFRRSIKLLDKMITQRDRHEEIAALLPTSPVRPLPGLRDAPLDWTALPASLVASCDAAIERAINGERPQRDRFGGKLGEDPLPRRSKNKRKIRNPENRRKNHRQALSWLIRHTWEDRTPPPDVTQLEDLLTAKHVTMATAKYAERTTQSKTLKTAKETSSTHSWLATLDTLAKRNDLGDDVLDAIADLRFSDAVHSDYANEMAAERAAFLKLLDHNPEVVRAILTGPRVLAREARRGLDGWDKLGVHAQTEALHLAMASAAMALQLSRPLRTRNIHELTISGQGAELCLPRRKGSLAMIDIARTRVKNNRDIFHEVPAVQWKTLALWIEEGREKWCTRHGTDPELNPYLFPGIKSGEAISRGTFNKFWNRGMSRIGVIGLNPHLMRHVGATLYIAQNPGAYGVVADLLGDKLDTVQAFYARGAGREASRLFAEVIQRLDPTLQLS
ncbi:hypothetical protein [Thioclava nitratireducens]|uniref:hypothetical protein n=1 Tax=Thioclava nitratireducens TaxID=1915078 RepID=UPI002481142C|nr:hypothetical protein [Thioclava nitratireducens]WGT52598.1 hypothetical protein P0N61_20795 [Thioclava nitratireducens]